MLLDRNTLFLMERLVRLVFHATASMFMKCINLSGMGAALWLVLHPDYILPLNVSLFSGITLMSGPLAASAITSASMR